MTISVYNIEGNAENKPTVWIVLAEIDYTASTLIGSYSNEARAREAIEEATSADDYLIQECIIDE